MSNILPLLTSDAGWWAITARFPLAAPADSQLQLRRSEPQTLRGVSQAESVVSVPFSGRLALQQGLFDADRPGIMALACS